MKFIRTFDKDISPDQLGLTNCHEHIVCRPAYWIEKKVDDLLLDDPEKSILDLQDFVRFGGRSIVDATAIDYGRDVNAVYEISKKAGVQVVGTAGFNKSFLWDTKVPAHLKPIIGNFETYKDWVELSSIEQLVDHVVREVTIGLEGTTIKAGQVKFGTGYNSITPLEEKTIRVIARAHKLTGAPIHSHCEAGTMAIEQMKILLSEDINMSVVSFGHMDRNIDLYYYEKLAETGAYLSFDGLGKNKYGPESARIDAIIALIKMGYENQILLGGDTARKTYYKHYGYYGLGLGWMLETWLPRFVDQCNRAGLDGKQLAQKLLVENPARYLTFREIHHD
ncbi:MAG: phosphotriesterase-related [Erysipelotrichaceae bacterium]|nr:MAG: phosphotriesterase-related [Erysipelotrichaceae bacterium]